MAENPLHALMTEGRAVLEDLDGRRIYYVRVSVPSLGGIMATAIQVLEEDADRVLDDLKDVKEVGSLFASGRDLAIENIAAALTLLKFEQLGVDMTAAKIVEIKLSDAATIKAKAEVYARREGN